VASWLFVLGSSELAARELNQLSDETCCSLGDLGKAKKWRLNPAM
jgi:hypothetical protein